MSALTHVRKAVASDAPALAGLSGQLGYPTDATALATRVRELRRHKEQCVFVAEAPPGLVIGWVQVAVHHSLMADAEGEIVGLVVDAAQRGRGVGRRLMEAAEGWISGRGLTAVRLRSRVQRVEAHRFYERLGYARIKEQIVLRKELPLERR